MKHSSRHVVSHKRKNASKLSAACYAGDQLSEVALQAAADELTVVATVFQCYESKRGASLFVR